MAMICSWCGENASPQEDGNHSICLDCVRELLRRVGEDAELHSWKLAFEMEREFPDPAAAAKSKAGNPPKSRKRRACDSKASVPKKRFEKG